MCFSLRENFQVHRFTFLRKSDVKNAVTIKSNQKPQHVQLLNSTLFFSVLCMGAHYPECVFTMTLNVSSHLDRLHLAKYHLRTA